MPPQIEQRQDVVAAIMSVDTAQAVDWDPSGYQEYRDGVLHLTAEQWDRVTRRSPCHPGQNVARAAWGIPVRVID